MNKGSAAQEFLDFSFEQNKTYLSLFPCDIHTLIGLSELEEKNEIMLDLGLRKGLAFQS